MILLVLSSYVSVISHPILFYRPEIDYVISNELGYQAISQLFCNLFKKCGLLEPL